MALMKWLLKLKMHAKTCFWILFCMKIRYIFLSLRNLAVYMKTRLFFCFIIFFAMFWQKPDILILDLYLYSIKIQTNIKKNDRKICRKITFFSKGFFWTRPDPAQTFWSESVLSGPLNNGEWINSLSIVHLQNSRGSEDEEEREEEGSWPGREGRVVAVIDGGSW